MTAKVSSPLQTNVIQRGNAWRLLRTPGSCLVFLYQTKFGLWYTKTLHAGKREAYASWHRVIHFTSVPNEMNHTLLEQ